MFIFYLRGKTRREEGGYVLNVQVLKGDWGSATKV